MTKLANSKSDDLNKKMNIDRLTTAQRTALAPGANDCFNVYDTDLTKMFFWSGSAWLQYQDI